MTGYTCWHKVLRTSVGLCEIPTGHAEEVGCLKQPILINQEIAYILSQLHCLFTCTQLISLHCQKRIKRPCHLHRLNSLNPPGLPVSLHLLIFYPKHTHSLPPDSHPLHFKDTLTIFTHTFDEGSVPSPSQDLCCSNTTSTHF